MQIKTRLIAVNDGNSKLNCNMFSLQTKLTQTPNYFHVDLNSKPTTLKRKRGEGNRTKRRALALSVRKAGI